jgi:hypothetical protein
MCAHGKLKIQTKQKIPPEEKNCQKHPDTYLFSTMHSTRPKASVEAGKSLFHLLCILQNLCPQISENFQFNHMTESGASISAMIH